MLIDTQNGSLYFTIFYSLAFLLAFLMLLWEGYQRKIPVISWVLLLIFAIVSFISGTKIFAFSHNDWLFMFNHATLIPTSEKILLGGILMGVIAIITGKYVLKIKQPLLDAFAFVFPLGIGVQKIGCFLNGCCFGEPTTLPWGVQYAVNTAPHFHQFKSGQIGANDLISIPIHPVQLYEVATAFLVIFIVFMTRKFWKANGSLFIFSMLLYSFTRFITEFFSDTSAYPLGWSQTGVFNVVQWAMILITIVLTFILLYREKRIPMKIQLPAPLNSNGIKFYLLIFTFEALVIYALRNWFSPSEIISVILTFFITGLIFVFWILKQIISSKAKMAYAGLLILPLLITGQIIPEAKKDSTLIVRTNRISFGMGIGQSVNTYDKFIGKNSDGCNQYDVETFKQKYTVGGAGYSRIDQYPEKRYSTNYGINLFMGQNKEVLQSTSIENRSFVWGINPFYKFDGYLIGAGAGLHFGNLLYPKNDNKEQADLTTGLVNTPVFPQVYLRIGPKRIFFVDYHLADQIPSSFPGYVQEFGIGTGFGSINETNFRTGFVSSVFGTGSLIIPAFYCSSYIPIDKRFSVEPLFVFSKNEFFRFSFALHYNLSTISFYKKNK